MNNFKLQEVIGERLMLTASIMKHAKINWRWNIQYFKFYYVEYHGGISLTDFVAQFFFIFKMMREFDFISDFFFLNYFKELSILWL